MSKRGFRPSRQRRLKLWSLLLDEQGLPKVLLHGIKFEAGEAMVLTGKARQVRDDEGALIGYQLRTDRRIAVKPKTYKLPEGELPQSGVMSFAEVEAAAGLHGKSHTQGLDEEQRNTRMRSGLEPEDFIERAARKRRDYVGMAETWRYSGAADRARQLGRVLE